MSQDEILTISDVASYLKVTEKTLYGLAQKGGRPVDTEANCDNPDSKTN